MRPSCGSVGQMWWTSLKYWRAFTAATMLVADLEDGEERVGGEEKRRERRKKERGKEERKKDG